MAVMAAAGPPSGPVTQTTSPGRAPLLSIGSLSSISPMAVPVTIPGPFLVSPPAIPVPQNSAHWSIPLMMSQAACNSRSSGSANAARNPTGLAPMAARSLKLTAAEYHPNCSYVMPAAMCLSNETTSVDAVTPRFNTAASSPGPTDPSGLMNSMNFAMSPLSPRSPNLDIVASSGAHPLKTCARGLRAHV